MDLTGKKIGIFGIQGSGKTILAKKLIRSFRKPIIYEVNPDFRTENCMIYKPSNLGAETLNIFCGKVKQLI
jgi:predicted AAA+ superfamily ATPase